MTRESGKRGTARGQESAGEEVCRLDREYRDGYVPLCFISLFFVIFPPYPDTAQKGIVLEHEEWVWAGAYTLLSMITRFWRIGAANYVVWDEAHFGKFGTHYINRDFYFDVHPPLGKMLVGLAGLLSGYKGNFEFKSGVAYPEDVPYTAMRVMLASFGVALVPLAWFTSGEMGWSRWTRHWVTICVLCGEFYLSILFFFASHGPCGLIFFQTLDGFVFPDLFFSTPCSYSSPLRPLLVLSSSAINDTPHLARTGGYGLSSRDGRSVACVVSSGWECLSPRLSAFTRLKICGKSLVTSRCPLQVSFIERKKKKKNHAKDTIAHVHHPLGCPNHLPYNPSLHRLRLVFQNAFPHPQPIRPR